MLCSFTDYMILVTGLSTTHLRAMVESISVEMKNNNVRALGVEGGKTASSAWILMDYGDVVVHLFQAEPRKYYNLERLWGDAPREPWEGQDKPAEE